MQNRKALCSLGILEDVDAAEEAEPRSLAAENPGLRGERNEALRLPRRGLRGTQGKVPASRMHCCLFLNGGTQKMCLRMQGCFLFKPLTQETTVQPSNQPVSRFGPKNIVNSFALIRSSSNMRSFWAPNGPLRPKKRSSRSLSPPDATQSSQQSRICCHSLISDGMNETRLKDSRLKDAYAWKV